MSSLDYLDELEAEAIYIIREAEAEYPNGVILFSGGKDSIVLTHLAMKAFYPQPLPFGLLQIDTGFNFPETTNFITQFISKHSLNLLVGKVEDDIASGKISDNFEAIKSRNQLQTFTLNRIIKEKKWDVVLGGGRRDEEKARAKERIFSHRDEHGKWNPHQQRPEVWNIFNTLKKENEHFRVFPLSNWTELDVWHYIKREEINLPSIYFTHRREVIQYNGMILACGDFISDGLKIQPKEENVRCRTIGDMATTGLWYSTASNVQEVIEEIRVATLGERGGRADDKVSEAAMEERKLSGYF